MIMWTKVSHCSICPMKDMADITLHSAQIGWCHLQKKLRFLGFSLKGQSLVAEKIRALISSHLISSHLISSHLISSHLISVSLCCAYSMQDLEAIAKVRTQWYTIFAKSGHLWHDQIYWSDAIGVWLWLLVLPWPSHYLDILSSCLV